MLEKHLYPKRVVVDVIVPAIYLVKDHPGHKYVYSYLENLQNKGAMIYSHSITPYRVLWILSKLWGLNFKESYEAVKSFIQNVKVEYVGLTRELIMKSFEIAETLKHDIYDCTYLALALMVKAEAIVTTDTDFEKLAPKIGLKYVNPVPKDVLKRFHKFPS